MGRQLEAGGKRRSENALYRQLEKGVGEEGGMGLQETTFCVQERQHCELLRQGKPPDETQ